jgi:hypothetical protein
VLHYIADEIPGAGTLARVWTKVDAARVHVRMPRQPPRSSASPPIVLIHGDRCLGPISASHRCVPRGAIPCLRAGLARLGLCNEPARVLSVTELAGALAAWQ